MSSRDSQLPMVSVVIPCYNDADTLGLVLAGLSAQTYPSDRIEIIVVDNGSTDCSRQVAQSLGIEPLYEALRSSYVSRNRGILASKGEYLLFLDADTVPEQRWIEYMVDAALKAGSGLVGGRIENHVLHYSLGSMLLSYTRSADFRRCCVEERRQLSGGNMLVLRTVFDRVGVFLPVRSGGDIEFARRANPDRKTVPYAESAIVTHLCNITTWSYICRAARIACGQVSTHSLAFKGWRAIPWRPGVRRAMEVSARLRDEFGVDAGRFLFVRIFLVLWCERWSFFLGSLVAHFRSQDRRDIESRESGGLEDACI